MSSPLFERQRAAQQAAFADHIGCALADFRGGGLTICERPAGTAWQYIAYTITWGGGVVVSTAPGYRDAVAQLVTDPEHAFGQPFIEALVEVARSRGGIGMTRGSGLGFALSEMPASREAPAGFRLHVEDAAWMTAEQAGGHWPNSLGTGADADRSARNRYAVVLSDAAGAPVAVGGVLGTWGLAEIGVDVAPAYRGNGFGRLVVQAAARSIAEGGETLLYGCDLENIRSQRTALASGFLPSYAYTYVAGESL